MEANAKDGRDFLRVSRKQTQTGCLLAPGLHGFLDLADHHLVDPI